MPGGVGSLAWMMKSSRVMAGGDDCEGVTSVSVNDKKKMIATVADGPLRGQPIHMGLMVTARALTTASVSCEGAAQCPVKAWESCDLVWTRGRPHRPGGGKRACQRCGVTCLRGHSGK